MKFNTPVAVGDFGFRISSRMRGLVVGSCFAEHIGLWLQRGKMPVEVNPFGVLYNPASIAKGLERLRSGVAFRESDLFEYNGLWHSSMHHGSFSGPDPEAVVRRMNRALVDLQGLDYLILTLGTAWVYERGGEVAANCHKMPPWEFTRRRMRVEQIVDALGEQIDQSGRDTRVILTVSPVIHPGDGLTENQLSKSTLIVAAHELAAKYRDRAHYFPAYEIVTGELRDYRFYAGDMCHPSESAVEYIRERFAQAVLTQQARELIGAAEALERAMEHRPLQPESPEHRAFRLQMREKAERLQQKYKNLDFTKEISFFT